jgi:hypothetical protein
VPHREAVGEKTARFDRARAIAVSRRLDMQHRAGEEMVRRLSARLERSQKIKMCCDVLVLVGSGSALAGMGFDARVVTWIGSAVALVSSAVAVWLANRAEAIGGARLVDVYKALVEHTAHTGVLSNHLAEIVRDETSDLSDQRCRALVADGNDQAERLNVLIKSIPSSVRP